MLVVAAICFLAILLAQISPANDDDYPAEASAGEQQKHAASNQGMDGWPPDKQFYIDILDVDLFPGPHSAIAREPPLASSTPTNALKTTKRPLSPSKGVN